MVDIVLQQVKVPPETPAYHVVVLRFECWLVIQLPANLYLGRQQMMAE